MLPPPGRNIRRIEAQRTLLVIWLIRVGFPINFARSWTVIPTMAITIIASGLLSVKIGIRTLLSAHHHSSWRTDILVRSSTTFWRADILVRPYQGK